MAHGTHGKEDAERASLPFVLANAALASGQEATVLLTIDGAWVATQGYPDGVQAKDLAPLSELVQKFVAGGGKLWVCGACAKPRGITQEHLIAGAEIVGAATVAEALVNGAQTLSW
jgi:predicted peroxiredoxin